MNIIKDFWQFLSGKKMIIGLAISWIVARAWFWDLIPDGKFEMILKDVLPELGNYLAGLGVVHKIAKAIKKK